MNDQATILINKIKTKFVLARFLEVLLFSVGLGLIVFGVSVFTGFSESTRLVSSVLAGVLFLIATLRIRGSFKISSETIAEHVSLHHPELEYSTDLLIADDASLTRMERLQKEKAKQNFEKIFKSIKVPFSLSSPALVILLGGLSSFLLSGIEKKAERIKPMTSIPVNSNVVTLPPALQNFEIVVSTPAYMQRKPTQQQEPELRLQEGSNVRWSFAFSDSVQTVYFIFSGSDSVAVSENKGSYSLSRSFFESGFYQIGWVDKEGEILNSDFYRIDVQLDAPPVVEITNPPQFLDVKFNDNQKINVGASLKDDWGMRDAHIIATISKGSGESVKFREETLLFSKPTTISGKKVEASLQIDLKKMGMEPGDELYFYVVGFDNKQPVSNHTRTETHFIVLEDTAKIEWAMDAGLGVDLMPEYFRSQRQIIIDTEKLLREKKAISKQEFNSRSNELGYDQKLLRLKYGEFLGEEFESGITQQDNHADETAGVGEDPLAAYSHKHDVEGEHQEVVIPEKKEGEKEDPLSAFVHRHDDSEVATFFEQSIRAKLKAALAIMWDAELYLRLYEPEKSLPFQYRALKLLKEISNDSRIYVHKVGFDPPPVKEDKRLTGELNEVYTNTAKWNTSAKVKFPQTRIALQRIEMMLAEDDEKVAEHDRFIFQDAGNEIAAEILKNPSVPLETLTLLKNLSDGSLPKEEVTNSLLTLRKYLTRMLPNEPESIRKSSGPIHPLEDQFIESIEKIR